MQAKSDSSISRWRFAPVRFAGASLCVIAFAGSATAAEFDYRVSGGVGYTDNIGRTPTDEVDTTIATAGLQFAFDQQTAKLQADVVGDIAYYDYQDDTFNSEVLGNVYANGLFAIVPERFIWTAIDQFGQVLTDPFSPPTPANRQNINYASTGPDVMIGLGSQMRLRLGGRYSMTTYETAPLDSKGVSGSLSLIREISDRRSLSFNVNQSNTKYDEEALDADFNQTAAFARYEAHGARTNVQLDAGWNRLHRDATDDDQNGALLNLELSRRISAASTLVFRGGREFSSSAGDFRRDQGFTNVGLDATPGTQTADPFELDHATVGYEYFRNRSGFGVSATWEDRNYDDNPLLNQTLDLFSAHVRRDLSPRVTVDLAASYTKGDFAGPSPSYDETSLGFTLQWRLTRNVSLRATADHVERNSDLPSGEFTENRVMVTIGWGRGDPRATRVPPSFGVDSVTGN